MLNTKILVNNVPTFSTFAQGEIVYHHGREMVVLQEFFQLSTQTFVYALAKPSDTWPETHDVIAPENEITR